jgi:hypothetical protein
MSEPQPDPEAEPDGGHSNIVLLVAFVAIVGIGIWLVNALLEARTADECMSRGGRGCSPIEVTPR